MSLRSMLGWSVTWIALAAVAGCAPPWRGTVRLIGWLDYDGGEIPISGSVGDDGRLFLEGSKRNADFQAYIPEADSTSYNGQAPAGFEVGITVSGSPFGTPEYPATLTWGHVGDDEFRGDLDFNPSVRSATVEVDKHRDRKGAGGETTPGGGTTGGTGGGPGTCGEGSCGPGLDYRWMDEPDGWVIYMVSDSCAGDAPSWCSAEGCCGRVNAFFEERSEEKACTWIQNFGVTNPCTWEDDSFYSCDYDAVCGG